MSPLEQRWPEVRFAAASAALVAAHAESRTASVPAASIKQPLQSKLASLSTESPVSASASANATRRATGVKRAAEKTVDTPVRSAVSSSAKMEPVPAPATRQPQPKPAFRDVLKGTAALAKTPTGSLAASKSTCLTLRVSDGEQARILACAAQANLSVSAYLRQCALGVDELRNQVETALLKLQKEQERELPPPGFAAIPGIFRRFGTRCLRGLQRNDKDHSAISIR